MASYFIKPSVFSVSWDDLMQVFAPHIISGWWCLRWALFFKGERRAACFLNSSDQFFVCVCPLTSGLVTKISHVSRRSCRIPWLSRYDFHAERQARTPPPHCLSSVRLSGNRRLIINTCHTRTSSRVLQCAHAHSVRYRRPTPTCSQPQTDVRTHCSDTASAFICATCLM